MKYKYLLLLLLIFPLSHADSLTPLEHFFKNPACSSYSISPDGKHIAWLASWKNRMNIFTKSLGSTEKRQLTFIDSRDISGFSWEGNKHIVFAKDNKGDENFHIYSININTLKEIDHTPGEKVKSYIVDDLYYQDEKLLIATNKRDAKYFDVYELNINTSSLKLKYTNKENIRYFLTDHQGTLIVALAIDQTTKNILYRKNENTAFQTLLSVSFPDSFYPFEFDFDNKNLLVLSNINRDKLSLFSYNPETKIQTELFSSPDADLSSILISKKRKKLLGVSWHTNKRNYHFFDEKRKLLQEKLHTHFPDSEPVIIDSDREEENLIIAEYSDIKPVSYHLYSLQENRFTLLGESAPWINPREMRPITTHYFTSRDNYKLMSYLSLPDNNKKPYPLVLIPHGGPEARDYWGFDRERQFLNNRGYAVLSVNFRGSTGFGKEHHRLGFKEWGRGIMQTDLYDAVDSLIQDGVIDNKRMAIFGTSYGGYAVLSALTFAPDIFSCGISFCGPSNLFTMFESIPPYWEGLRELMYKKIGHPEKEKEFIKNISPLYFADNIKVPLMIAQGKNDPRVKQEESDQIVNILRNKKIKVPYILEKDEGHGFMNEENIINFYKCLEAFLAEHLGGKSSTDYSYLSKYEKP